MTILLKQAAVQLQTWAAGRASVALLVSESAFEMVIRGVLSEREDDASGGDRNNVFVFVSRGRDIVLPIKPMIYEQVEVGTAEEKPVVRFTRAGSSISVMDESFVASWFDV